MTQEWPSHGHFCFLRKESCLLSRLAHAMFSQAMADISVARCRTPLDKPRMFLIQKGFSTDRQVPSQGLVLTCGRNCSAQMTTMSFFRTRSDTPTRCLPKRNGAAFYGALLDAQPILSKVLLLIGFGSSLTAVRCTCSTSTITFPSYEDRGGCFMLIRDMVFNRQGFASFTSCILCFTQYNSCFHAIHYSFRFMVKLPFVDVSSPRCC